MIKTYRCSSPSPVIGHRCGRLGPTHADPTRPCACTAPIASLVRPNLVAHVLRGRARTGCRPGRAAPLLKAARTCSSPPSAHLRRSSACKTRGEHFPPVVNQARSPHGTDDAPETAEEHRRRQVDDLVWGPFIALGRLTRAQKREYGMRQVQIHDVLNRKPAVLHEERAL
jgi:hypothetical protein